MERGRRARRSTGRDCRFSDLLLKAHLLGGVEPAAEVACEWRSMSHAEPGWPKLVQQPRGCLRRVVGVNVEDSDNRAPVVGGQGVAGDQRAVGGDSGVRAVGVTVGLLCARRLATRLRYCAPPEEEPNDRPRPSKHAV